MRDNVRGFAVPGRWRWSGLWGGLVVGRRWGGFRDGMSSMWLLVSSLSSSSVLSSIDWIRFDATTRLGGG